MHTLFCGVTQSGKTTLARMVAQNLAASGQRIIVFDPVQTKTLNYGWPSGSMVFTDPLEFSGYMADEESGPANSHVFVDEADEIFSLRQPENFWMLKKGRHFGLAVNVITQRPHLVAPTVRSQCGKAFVFRLGRDDARSIGAEYGHNLLLANGLDRGEFLILESGHKSFSRSHIPGLFNPQK